MKKTIFKQIIDRELPANIVYEDEHTLAFLDINPTAKGHTLVIPKEESEDIFKLSEESAKNLILTVKKVSVAVKNAVRAEGVNIIVNNGKSAGQIVPHLHFHIIPRNENDGIGTLPHTKYDSEEEIKQIHEKIKNLLV